jgi:glutathionyl-hydroquinone reductase
MTFASPADITTYGPYGRDRLEATRRAGRPDYPFQGRVGSPEFPAEPGRYHLYVAWSCPWAQRTAIVRELRS